MSRDTQLITDKRRKHRNTRDKHTKETIRNRTEVWVKIIIIIMIIIICCSVLHVLCFFFFKWMALFKAWKTNNINCCRLCKAAACAGWWCLHLDFLEPQELSCPLTFAQLTSMHHIVSVTLCFLVFYFVGVITISKLLAGAPGHAFMTVVMKNQPWAFSFLCMMRMHVCVCVCDRTCTAWALTRKADLVWCGYYFEKESRGVRTMGEEKRKQCSRCKRREVMDRDRWERMRLREGGWDGGVRRRGGGVAERIRHDSGEGRRRGKRWTGRNVPALLFEPAAWRLMLTPTHDPTAGCFVCAHYTLPVTPTSNPSTQISSLFMSRCELSSSLSKVFMFLCFEIVFHYSFSSCPSTGMFAYYTAESLRKHNNTVLSLHYMRLLCQVNVKGNLHLQIWPSQWKDGRFLVRAFLEPHRNKIKKNKSFGWS